MNELGGAIADEFMPQMVQVTPVHLCYLGALELVHIVERAACKATIA